MSPTPEQPDEQPFHGLPRDWQEPRFEVFGEVDDSAFGRPYRTDPTGPAATTLGFDRVDPAEEHTVPSPRGFPDGAEAADADPPPSTARDLAYSEISGQPTAAPLPGRYNVGRLLRRCAGVNEELLAWARTERARYTGLGGFVLLTALMAVGSSSVALMIAFDKPWYYVALPALFWGVLIFNLDRWIVSSPLPEHGLRRIATILPRLVMAIVFGVVIAEPVLLKVFESAVSEQLSVIRTAEDGAFLKLIQHCNPVVDGVPADPLQTDDCKDVAIPQSTAVTTAKAAEADAQKAVDDSGQRLATANTDLEAARVQMNNECRGLDGSPHGEGPVCKHLTDVYNSTLSHRDGVASEDATLRTALATASKAVADAKTAADKDRTAEVTRLVDEHRKNRNDKGGLLERIEALNSVAGKHLSLLLAIWAVRLLLILVDSAPAIGKFTSGSTTYDRLAREESRLGEQKHRARSTVEEDQAQNWIDESEEHEEIVRAERRHQRDRAADALLLAAAQHREQQASQFRPVVDESQPPFGRAAYAILDRVEPAGPARRPVPLVDTTARSTGPGWLRDHGRGDHDRRGDKRREEREPARDDPDEGTGRSWGPLPSINIVTLGGPGSGKTTFLAKLYDELRVVHPDRPFTLALPDGAQRTHLENWATTIRSLGGEWPDSTASTHLVRYEFTCKVAEQGVQRPVLSITYWDYSGEALLQNTALPDIDKLRHELSEKVARADALLIVVDGEDLRNASNGDFPAMAKLTQTMAKIEIWAQSATCPAQIVVTKWDDLEHQPHPQGGDWNRARIIEALRAIPAIEAIGRDRTYRAGRSYGASGMRVIPVSVVGGAGSTQRGADRPIRVRQAEPVNIDVPFAGLLPDRLDQIYAAKGSAAIERQLRLARSNLLWGTVSVTAGILRRVLEVLPFLGAPSVLAKLADVDLSKWLPSYLVDRLEQARERSKEDLRLLKRARKLRESASRVEQARHLVLRAFSERLLRFDRNYPETEPVADRTVPDVLQSRGEADNRRWV